MILGRIIDSIESDVLLDCEEKIRLLKEVVHWESRGEDLKYIQKTPIYRRNFWIRKFIKIRDYLLT